MPKTARNNAKLQPQRLVLPHNAALNVPRCPSSVLKPPTAFTLGSFPPRLLPLTLTLTLTLTLDSERHVGGGGHGYAAVHDNIVGAPECFQGDGDETSL